MKIRKAIKDDFKELFKLKLLSKKEELKYSKTIKSLNESKQYYEEYLQLDLTKPDRVIFIAIDGKKIIGAIVGKFFTPLRISKYKKKGHISNLYINKNYRKKGIAGKLVKKTLEWLKINNVPHASLEIHTDNQVAINLYHKLGFNDFTVKMVKKI
tara:strand:+ start:31 stop:495 length:465 start_codon:yes stop_codon:yes gene_type:complete